MLSRRYRFQRRNSLRYVYIKGKTVRSGYLSLRFIKNPKSYSSRLAVVVSKKQSKRAVDRNRIRRRVYELARQRWPMITPGYDMVITVFDERLRHVPIIEVDRLVSELFKRSNVLKI